jgi:ATP-dependent helicase/nuclease subunit A
MITSAPIVVPDPQKQAAQPQHSVWVTANAGTGKTTVLINRVARLLLAEADPEEILCVTYTKAAAAEMQARLFERLGAWSTADDARLTQELRELGEPGLTDADLSEKRLKRARSLFAQALETPGGLRIETIHAFCTRLLRRFPLEAGVPPGFQMIEESDAAKLWKQAIDQLARLIMAEPEHPQAQALQGFISLLDGADPTEHLQSFLGKHAAVLDQVQAAGGLENVEHMLRWSLGAGVQSSTAIAQVFLDAAPIEALQTLHGVLKADKKKALIEAIRNDFANPDLTAIEHRFERYVSFAFSNFQKNPRPAKQELLTADIMKKHPDLAELFRCKTDKGPLGTEIARILAAWEPYTAARAAERSSVVLRVIVALGTRYRQLKSQRAALDFDDLVRSTRHLLSTTSAAQWVLFKLDGGLSHILLDEAQDTSPDQWPLFNALATEFFAGESRASAKPARTMFVVGDEKQSIYSFQGADPAGFLRQRQDFLRDGRSDRISPVLAKSFRTVPQVLQVVDSVLAQHPNQARPPIAAGPPVVVDLPRHASARQDHIGSVELWDNLVIEKADVPQGTEEDDPDAPVDAPGKTDAQLALAREIAVWVRQLIDTRTMVHERCSEAETVGPVPRWRPRPVRAGDIMILTRKRGRLTGLIRAELMKQNVPTAGADRLNLSDPLLVQDCLNVLRFLLAPHDDLIVAEILKGPLFGWSDDDLFALAHPRPQHASLWDALQSSPDQQVKAVCDCLRSWHALSDKPAFDVLLAVLEQHFQAWHAPASASDAKSETGFVRIYRRFGEAARLLLTTLLNAAVLASQSGKGDLQRFLHSLEHKDSAVKREPDRSLDAVQIMTVHGAKGLEAPVVILPQTTEGTTKAQKLLFDSKGLPVWMGHKRYWAVAQHALNEVSFAAQGAESARLLYVAMTRAQDHLLVCGHAHGGAKIKEAADGWRLVVQTGLLACDPQTTSTPRGRGALRLGERQSLPESAQLTHKGAAQTMSLPWLAKPATPERVGMRLVAPSALVDVSAPALAPFGADREARLRRGRLIHRLVERLPDAPPDLWTALGQKMLSREPDLPADLAAEILMSALSVVTDSRFSAVFGPGSRAEAGILGGAPGLPKGMLINGRVDRLVILPDRIVIVDLKTDRPAPRTVDAVGQAYLTQLSAYVAVLAAAYPGRKVEAALLWSDGPAWMPVPPEVLEAALKAL